jgi:uncharacterized protein YdeI (YjbR/CyaY-like superfamily)
MMNPKVDQYLSQATAWREEMATLRKLILGAPLTEELKWSKPCYTFDGKNVVIIQDFKAYCALLFFKGALLKERPGLLIKTGENTQVGRQIRFTDVRQITKLAPVLKACIAEAIAVEKAGLKVKVTSQPKPVPEELQTQLGDNPALNKAFAALTPGRQRAYIYYFSAPKQSKTRQSRVEKYRRQILLGKGLNDL